MSSWEVRIRYAKGDVLALPVTDEKFALAQVVSVDKPSVLLAVFLDLYVHDQVGLAALNLDEPVLLAVTVDLYIEQGSWRRLGSREVSGLISPPTYRVWVEPPGEYRRQDIHGTVGEVLTAAEARALPNHKSWSPAVVEAALRGLHGFGPWHPVFDELAADR